MGNRRWRILFSVLGVLAVLSGGAPAQPALAGAPVPLKAPGDLPQPPEAQALRVLESMQPEEKVGQLMLVTFNATDASPGSPIYRLITEYHVGGVVLLSANDNFTDKDNTVKATWELTRLLQVDEWQGSQKDVVDENGDRLYTPVYIPLLIGLTQEGDGAPNSQILDGLTPLPNQMAIGATWDRELARSVGGILGNELSAIGVNLLFGPSVDILEDPKPEGSGDMGTRTFGGDPFWVGEMAKAYIEGIHQGSEQTVAVTGKYFPGRGGSDRLPEDEVATIRKSLDQLNQIELAPFFAITGNQPGSDLNADALLASHIRYQGFQGNIRTTTRPVSFDSQALTQLMSLDPLKKWREENGVLISDDLGNQAVRRFYDPTGEVFNARLVARDALLAGNDLLYLGNFVASGDKDSFTTIEQTLNFFKQKYEEDDAFAQRVDEAVLRILTLKYSLYPEFTLSKILPLQTRLAEVGKGEQTTFKVAQKAATLIDPSSSELDGILPNPPQMNERIVFITDTYVTKQCSTCANVPALAVDALQQAVARLYGQTNGGQVRRTDLISFSSDRMRTMLDKNRGSTDLEFYLRQADWIVFGLLNHQKDVPDALIVRRFLTERPDLLRGKNVILFAFNAPYYLDATDVSKVTAYYGLYAKGPQFVETAARILFNELRPVPGKSPVSIPGSGYDLISVISPDPSQIIPLRVESSDEAAPAVTSVAGSVPARQYAVGDLIPVLAGPILDYNGHAVPDNTPVHFYLSVAGGSVVEEIIAPSVAGFARSTFSVKTPGTLEISAKSEMASRSQIVRIEVPGEGAPLIALPTLTEPPVPTPTATALVPTPEGNAEDGGNDGRRALMDWTLALLVGGIIAWFAYRSGLQRGQVRWSMRTGLLTFIGGLIGYIYITLRMPGGELLWNATGHAAGVLATVLGNGLGWLAAGFWYALTESK